MKHNLSMKLFGLVVVLSVLHHVDHVLRVDHSGWPFLPRVSPFTYSLLAYPILLSIFLARSNSWYRVMGTAVLFLSATLAHIFFEPMQDKFHTWTYGSNLPRHVGEQNLLGYNATWLGVCSVVLAVLLSLTLFLTMLSFIRDAGRGINNLQTKP